MLELCDTLNYTEASKLYLQNGVHSNGSKSEIIKPTIVELTKKFNGSQRNVFNKDILLHFS